MSNISRQQIIEQSVQDYLRAKLAAHSIPADAVTLLDAFDYQQFNDQALDREYVAAGFNFDRGAKPMELGSSLCQRTHVLEFWVFATTPQRGKALAGTIRDSLDDEGLIPLLDYNQDGNPVMDQLQVDETGLRAQRQPHPSPKPWQENAWTVTLPVIDTFYASDE
jgi:hypothetical protein